MRSLRVSAFPALFALLLASASRVPLGPGQDPTNFTSDAAKKAASKYADQIAKLEEEHAGKLRKVIEQYAKELDEARKLALANDDLDEAQRVLKAKNDALKPAERPLPRRGFDVVTARWGALTNWVDVTTPLRAKIRDGELSIVPEQMNFPDPIDGTRKSLVVMFVKDGKLDLAIVGDGQPLKLPPTSR
jgi:hypothetical protein